MTTFIFCGIYIKAILLLVVSTSEANNPPFNNSSVLPDLDTCGAVIGTDRLYGGHFTELGEFPWIVALEYKDTSTGASIGVKCVGSLINSRYVLTAAHCLTKPNKEPYKARLGDWKLATDPDCFILLDKICAPRANIISIQSKLPHEGFNKVTAEHDIALLKLSKEVHFSEFIQPVCLSSRITQSQTNFVAVSWSAFKGEEDSDDTLQAVSLPLVPINECETILKRTLPSNVFCAGGQKGRDTCYGDGGAPLAKIVLTQSTKSEYLDANWFQEGITSWGVGCGRQGVPAVYTNVSNYIDWIIKNISLM